VARVRPGQARVRLDQRRQLRVRHLWFPRSVPPRPPGRDLPAQV